MHGRHTECHCSKLIAGRPILYDVVMQSRDTTPRSLVPHYDYGSVWSPEVYGGRNAMRTLGNMWWSLPCNKYDAWQACVGGSMKIVNSSECYDPTRATGAALRGLLPMLDYQDIGRPGFSAKGHWEYGGPGGWNHLDQLMVCLPGTWQGPGLTSVEQQAHMGLWAVLASPLLLAMDLRTITPTCLKLVTNQGALAISNDPLGAPGRRLLTVRGTGTGGTDIIQWQVWGRQLSGGAVSVILFNRMETAASLHVNFTQLEELHFSPAPGAHIRVEDVWTGAVLDGAAAGLYETRVLPHAAAFLRLSISS